VPRNDGSYLQRNAIVALGNTGTAEQLELLDGVEDEHADWARARIEERG
jgi:epoxyqueuosine reductase QueG